MTAANQNLGALYNQGIANAGADQMLRAGELQRAADQGQMDADRADFEGNRDFNLDQYMRYNAGILNNAPQSVGQVPANLVDPLSAAVGSMSGYGFENSLISQLQSHQLLQVAQQLWKFHDSSTATKLFWSNELRR